MKTLRILNLVGVAIIGILLTARLGATNLNRSAEEKKAVTISVNKPVVEFLTKAFGDRIDSRDIVRMQKILGQIDHITISFRGEEAFDYLLKFEPMNDQELESWMFDEGYLNPVIEPEVEVIVPWMENMHFNPESETEMEVPVPWMENIHFTGDSETEMEVPVPWMENMHLG